uniref:Uncharacterized protein n=1 Tax=Strombidium inclinatum TaxID=197538 RepID=A0A7S3N1A4_9SPIT|mmetsp:Transcript_38536/g.58653  ORF Transcript_38536/g.58653 Transcript_38536/m.58653 type:complete len:213 (+) Transcript_38536:568-1206(+)
MVHVARLPQNRRILRLLLHSGLDPVHLLAALNCVVSPWSTAIQVEFLGFGIKLSKEFLSVCCHSFAEEEAAVNVEERELLSVVTDDPLLLVPPVVEVPLGILTGQLKLSRCTAELAVVVAPNGVDGEVADRLSRAEQTVHRVELFLSRRLCDIRIQVVSDRHKEVEVLNGARFRMFLHLVNSVEDNVGAMKILHISEIADNDKTNARSFGLR